MKTPSIIISPKWCIPACLAMFALSSQAANWDGPATGNWSDPTNWSGDVIPDATEAQINTGATVTIDSAIAGKPNNILIGNGSVITQTGGSLALGGGDWSKVGWGTVGSYLLSGGTLDTSGNNGWFVVGGDNAGGIGTFSITNATARVGSLAMAQDGATGTMNINAGGVLEVTNKIQKFGSTGVGTINLNGGKIRALAGNGTFIDNQMFIVLGAAGGTIDTNGFDTGIQSPISGTGNLTKIGGDQLKTGAVHTYTGNTIVSAGTFTIEGSGSLLFDINASGVNNQVIGSAGVNLNFNGSWRVLSQQVLPMTANTAPADQDLVQKIARFEEPIRRADKKLGELQDTVTEEQILSVYLASLTQVPGTQIAAYSRQSIRDEWPAGTLTASRVFNSLPWTTPLVQLTLTPEQLDRLGKFNGMFILKQQNLPVGQPLTVTTSKFFASLLAQELHLPAGTIRDAAVGSEFDYFVSYLAKTPQPLSFNLPEGWVH
ncbi:MAG: hypothetical protein WDN28_24615 [Chthoniobacter sp.]